MPTHRETHIYTAAILGTTTLLPYETRSVRLGIQRPAEAVDVPRCTSLMLDAMPLKGPSGPFHLGLSPGLWEIGGPEGRLTHLIPITDPDSASPSPYALASR